MSQSQVCSPTEKSYTSECVWLPPRKARMREVAVHGDSAAFKTFVARGPVRAQIHSSMGQQRLLVNLGCQVESQGAALTLVIKFVLHDKRRLVGELDGDCLGQRSRL